MRAWLMWVLLLAPALSLAGDPAAEKVLECMRGNIPKTVQIKQVELNAIDRAGGERQMRGRLYGTNEKGRLRAMIRIEAPPDLSGASYLMREGIGGGDEMYVFVPALNKVRRITGASVDGALWGTDLSYADIKQIQHAFSGASSKFEGAEQIGATPVDVVTLVPPVEEGSRYSSIKAWVDRKTCVALKVEFNEGSTVRKRLVTDPKDLKESDGRWYSSQAVMSDLKEGTRTRLKVLNVTIDKNLADRYFNPGTFYLGG